jgi:hypothetical protein
VVEGDFNKVPDAVRNASRDDIVLRLVLLKHEPHRLDLVAGEAAIAAGIEVAEQERLQQSEL